MGLHFANPFMIIFEKQVSIYTKVIDRNYLWYNIYIGTGVIFMDAFISWKVLGDAMLNQLETEFPEVNFIRDVEAGREAEVAIVMPNFFVDKNFDKYSKLRFIQLLMAGYDSFDLKQAEAKDIIVCNAQDIFSISVAEDAITKILVLNRNVKHYVMAMNNKEWKPIRKEPELTGSVIGILGTGSIGKELATKLKAFNTRVLGYGRKLKQVSGYDEIFTGETGLEYVLQNSDYVIVALPLTETTYHLLDENRLNMMKETALLINVARGDIIDQEALIKALREKKIRGAGLDVTTPEPLSKDNELWDLDNIFITPHNASSSPYMQERLTELVRINLHRYLNKQELLFIISK